MVSKNLATAPTWNIAIGENRESERERESAPTHAYARNPDGGTVSLFGSTRASPHASTVVFAGHQQVLPRPAHGPWLRPQPAALAALAALAAPAADLAAPWAGRLYSGLGLLGPCPWSWPRCPWGLASALSLSLPFFEMMREDVPRASFSKPAADDTRTAQGAKRQQEATTCSTASLPRMKSGTV